MIQEGSGNTDLYGPDFLLQKDVVVVTFNYRLGIIGFLSLKDPNLNVPGNAGLKDQNMALKWVQNNIEFFGGDSNQVTLFGQSVSLLFYKKNSITGDFFQAGAASTHFHMISDKSKDLFKRAIAFSGSTFDSWALFKPSNFAMRTAYVLGFNRTTEAELLKFLEDAKAEDLVMASIKLLMTEEKHLDFLFVPVVEPSWSKTPFLTQNPVVAARTAWSNNIDAIFGLNSFEGLFEAYRELSDGGEIIIDNFNKNPSFVAILGNNDLDPSSPQTKIIGQRIKNFYLGNSTKLSKDTMMKFYEVSLGMFDNVEVHEQLFYVLKYVTDYFFVHGNYRTIKSRLKHADECAKTYMSWFDGDSQLNGKKIRIRKGENVKL
jgi:cholinesterase